MRILERAVQTEDCISLRFYFAITSFAIVANCMLDVPS